MLQMQLILFIIWGLLMPLSPAVHEFHLSKCEMVYSVKEQSLQISMHIFIDDLEDALKERGYDSLYICTKKEHDLAELYIKDYLDDRFLIQTDDMLHKAEFIGKEASSDFAAVWCYLEIPNFPLEGHVVIMNQVLMDQFEDQKNITSIKLPGGIKKHYLFEVDDFTGELDLK